MDEELDPDDENVNSILAQEYSELLHILNNQPNTIIMKLCQMMPSATGRDVHRVAPSTSSGAVTEPVRAMLDYFSVADATECHNFLQSVCMLCENIPLHLETKLISVAGYAHSEYIQWSYKC